MNRTRVLLDCRMAYWSGVGRYTRGLVRALAALDRFDLVLVGMVGEEPVVADSEHVTHATARSNPISLGGGRELSQIIERHRPQLIHCLHFPTPSRVEYPLVTTVHDLTPLVVPGVMPSLLRRAVYRYMNGRAVTRSGRIITPSEATARDILRIFPRSEGKIAAIAEAADDFSAGELGILPVELPKGAPYILTMGNTRPHKDLPTLLDAFQRLAVNRPDLHLVLVGKEDRGYLDERLSGEPRRRAVFSGRVDDAELRALYARAAVFAFPSLYEGFGLPPLEAMALGAPVVAARAASVPEVVGDSAILVEPGDSRALLAAIARVLDNRELADDLRAKGLARAAAFTWSTTARLTAEVYDEVLAGGGEE